MFQSSAKPVRAFGTLLISLFLLAVAESSAQVTTAFTYQGELEQGGQPASGEFDFEFALYEQAVDGTVFAGPVVVEDVFADGGLFSAEVDFGMNVFGLTDLWLEVRVREGASTGGFTALDPRQKVTPAPLSLHTLNVEPGAVGEAQVLPAEVQLRIGQDCAPGQWVRAVAADGTVTCEADPGGDITEVTTGEGLIGGADAGTADLSVDFSLIRRKNEPMAAATDSGIPIQGFSESFDETMRLVNFSGGPLLTGNDNALGTAFTLGSNGDITSDGVISASAFQGDGAQVTGVDANLLDGLDSAEFAPVSHDHPHSHQAGALFLTAFDFQDNLSRVFTNAGEVEWDRRFPYLRILDCITGGTDPCPSLPLGAPLRLPQGSEITAFTLFHYDNDDTHDWEVLAALSRIDPATGSADSIGSITVNSSGAVDDVVSATNTSLGAGVVVDNTRYGYYVNLTLMDNEHALSQDLRVYGVRIDYDPPE